MPSSATATISRKRAHVAGPDAPVELPASWPQQGAFSAILADPPWNYRSHKGRGAAENHYTTMSDPDIAALPVGALAAKNCALFLWATGPKLDVAIATLKAWGFTYKGVFLTWVKTSAGTGQPMLGMGSYSRSCCEFCLLGVRGNVMPLKRSSSVHQLLMAPRREHSRKPDEARLRIEQFFGCHSQEAAAAAAASGGAADELRMVELFARTQAAGWTSWGLETQKFVEATAVSTPTPAIPLTAVVPMDVAATGPAVPESGPTADGPARDNAGASAEESEPDGDDDESVDAESEGEPKSV